jgi:predicted membrane protein
MVILSIYPNVLVNQHGGVDKISTYLLFWAMASGFIRGVGFVPQSRFFAVLFSGTACFITLFASLIHLKFI